MLTLPSVGRSKSADQMEQRRFAASAGSHHRDEFAWVDREIRMIERGDRRFARAVHFG